MARDTSPPPCLHVKAWWPKGSKAWDGQKGQRDCQKQQWPNHHFTAARNSVAGSRWKLNPTEGITESQAAACGDETESSCALSGNEALSSNSPR